jgi:hypothetical protein
MNSLRRHLSYANVVATLALVFAMSGGALAAKHYLINSTKQINPKVLKKLRGNTGKTGGQGLPGTQGPGGTQGKEGLQGKGGPQGIEGQRGPSDVYEVELAKSVEAATPGGPLTLTLSNLPAGTYAIFGKAGVVPTERKSGPTRCELRAFNDFDLTIFNFTTPGTGEEAAPITTELTHTFPSTGEVTMQCRFANAVKWALSTNPGTRIVAIRVDNQHKTTAEAG